MAADDFVPKSCEDIARYAIKQSANMLIPWYLITSYLYYHEQTSVISDACFDEICKRIDAEWDKLWHSHKGIIDREALKAGTGYYLKREAFPERIIGAARHLTYEHRQFQLKKGREIKEAREATRKALAEQEAKNAALPPVRVRVRPGNHAQPPIPDPAPEPAPGPVVRHRARPVAKV